jgi:adenine phosphoribosyltransferase
MDLKAKIRQVPDWPKKGILFYDVTTLLEDAKAFKLVVDQIVARFRDQGVEKVVGVDARGFLFAAPVAYQLGVGVSIVRKKGKLPFRTICHTYEKEYGPDTIEMHEDSVKKMEKVLIVDDLLATGGTMKATCELIERQGGEIAGIAFVIDLPFLGGRELLSKYKLFSLVEFSSK